ncbi:methylated-DNA--[protein]-cysteine S-methyltransferase [Nocardia sp. NPDC052566]|uniref:methylated-DNA--[protein]-cysteine S-methyltransferase n=1 Tax=Nocardia sp. NPDC052566 TaxID=3364330 RepID=UPI0037C855DD
MSPSLARAVHASAVGNLLLEASEIGITRVDFTTDAPAPVTGTTLADTHIACAITQLDEYLDGTRREFTVPLDRRAMSAFDRQVLEALETTTPYGETTTYGTLARHLDRPLADVRKIGGALSRNPFLILVACHRVVAADGALTGYAGGLPAKRALLDLESPDLLLPLAL